MILVDTSGFYAYSNANDQDHAAVREVAEREIASGRRLMTTSYVVSETMGLMQHRLGRRAVTDFVDRILPAVRILWIGEAEHAAGWALMQEIVARHFTIVDATAMAVMRRHGIRSCLSLDEEFRRQGYRVLPA